MIYLGPYLHLVKCFHLSHMLYILFMLLSFLPLEWLNILFFYSVTLQVIFFFTILFKSYHGSHSIILDLSKSVATHSSTLAWKIPWTEEPGGLQSMGSQRVGHDWRDFTFMHWRRKWQPTPVFLLGESQGQQSLVGCRLWGHTELDTTEMT